MNQYAAVSDMLLRIDQRILGDLVSDGNSRVNNVNGNPVLLAMLQSASGEINSACLCGERYTVSQLLALVDVDQQLLIELTCWLAFKRLRLRRGLPLEGFPQIVDAETMLQALRDGKRMFNVPGTAAAGLPLDMFPSMQFYRRLDLLRDRATLGYFSLRRKQSNT